MTTIHWLHQVEDHDYSAAHAYLTVLLDERRATLAVNALRQAPIQERRVNDILRGCHREPLPATDPGVKRDLRKIKHDKKLSPVLIISFAYTGDIADGYHRVSAAYQHDPFATIPCKLAHVPELARPTFAGVANL